MNFLHNSGEALIQRQAGNQQLAGTLARSLRVLARRLGHLLGTALSRLPGEHQTR